VKRDFFMEPPGWGKHARKFYLWGVCGSGKLTQRPRRRNSSRDVPRPAVARQYAGERAVGASQMEEILARGRVGTSHGSGLPGRVPRTFRDALDQRDGTRAATTRSKTKPTAMIHSRDK